MMLRAFAVLALLGLAGCGADNIYADDAAVMRARHVGEAPSITLYTVLNANTEAGAHSALLINGSESVLFDPAGSFKLSAMPERGDVLYGASPRWASAYIDYHARPTHFMRTQTLMVSPQTAEALLQAVKRNGAVNKAHCANSISRILGELPEFAQVRTTYFPKALEQSFGENPNVISRTFTDATADKSHGIRFIDPKDAGVPTIAALAP
jgi:hypothetical protein